MVFLAQRIKNKKTKQKKKNNTHSTSQNVKGQTQIKIHFLYSRSQRRNRKKKNLFKKPPILNSGEVTVLTQQKVKPSKPGSSFLLQALKTIVNILGR